MQKFLTFMVCFALSTHAKGQSNFSFNCRMDTTIECTTSCLNLKTTLPNIYSSTTSYSVNQISALSCFRPYVSAINNGPSANLLIDDRYSPPLDIGFPFSFYGNTYTQLIASTNGFLSFDISKATAFSHFGILKNGASLSSTSGIPEDLPSALYDKALIMGPYHDLDPNISTSTQQIKYDVIGTAPYRKWVLSYYNVPLYTTACLNLNYNTHQIVLYETLGIIEVFIFDKEICPNWNHGRAMIGLQDYYKKSAIMAPGRRASDVPWGKKGINESWRFIPASGQSLFKKVELYTLSGSFVAAGKTTVSNNILNVTFDNICPPSSGETYIVRSIYRDPGNLSAEITGQDTINISRGDPIAAKILPAGCAASNKGLITITNPVGPGYEYSFDGINWQAATSYIVPGGDYTIQTRIKGSNCISKKSVFVETETFTASIIKKVSPCPAPIRASIEVYPMHGTPQYNYSLNGGPFQTSNIFMGLTIGDYHVLVTDASGCTYSTDIRIDSTNLAEASTTNTICGKPGSGTIDVTAGFGTKPYTYSLNGAAFQSSNVFTGLTAGNYSITVKDSINCTYNFDAAVDADIVMYANPEIVRPDCYSNSNGEIVVHASSGIPPYLYSLNTGMYQTDSSFFNLKSGHYKLNIKDATGCILDTTIIVQQPNPVGGSAVILPATNCTSNNGEITVKANGGNVPYMYSINNGNTYQVSNIFKAKAGVFNIIIKDSTGCSAKISDTVQAMDSKLLLELGPDKTICTGDTAIIKVNSSQPVYLYNINPQAGLSVTPTETLMVSPQDTTRYIIFAKTDVCQGFDTIAVNVLHKPVADAGNDTVICNNTYATLRGTVKSSSGSLNYLWTPARDISNPNSPVTTVWPATTRPTRYRLEVTDNYGCNFKTFDDVVVTMRPVFIPSAGNDTIASIGLPHQLQGSAGVQYLWSPASVLNNPALQNPVAILQNDVRFNLIVKDSFGCIGTSSVLVKVYKGVTYYIPNAFTPNGDGINDTFKAIAPGIKQTNYFRIYDRWGKIMFQSNDVNSGWDGKYSGIRQPAAVYVWIINGTDVNGKIIHLKGIVTLIR
ncbi:MAG TPA: T9SS type B sorting domain-containing protein [Chitinophagaceae bacterium]|nr:T9SS type B sorting domain-containing protein [Chitinophagaceae bacterium]